MPINLTFGDHVRQLQEVYPQCESHLAESLVWQAAMHVYGEHHWTFLLKEDRVVTEAPYSTGTIAVTNKDTAMTLTGGTWDATWTQRRMLIGPRFEPYDMATVLAGSGTLSRAYQGDTDAAATYTIYRDTYSMPLDCDYGRTYFILDPTRGRIIRMKDFGTFQQRAATRLSTASQSSLLGVWATRVALDATTGVPTIRFDPYPSDVSVFPVIYFAGPTKPTAYTQAITPLFPQSHEDIIWRRALWLYAEFKRRWRERDQLRAIYYDRYFDAVKQFDGGNEMERYIRGTYPTLPFTAELGLTAARGVYS